MTAAINSAVSEYVLLKGRIPKAMFLSKDKNFYSRLARTLVSLTLITLALVWTDRALSQTWAPIATVALSVTFGILLTQVALLAHEVGHKSAIRNPKWNRRMSLFVGPVLLGVSYTWWNGKHNTHHEAPNRDGVDTDIDFPILAFDSRQASEKRKLVQPILRNQHLLILPLLTLQAINTQIGTVVYLCGKPKDYKLQLAGVTVHWLLLLSIAYLLGWSGVAFVTIALAVHGVCNGSVFAPNHKGMDIIERYAPTDRFRDQVIPSRNVHGNNRLTRRLVKFWYGGLEYQIEHHLYPTMPMDNLADISPTVVSFCEQVGVHHVSVTPWQSYKEVFLHLRKVAHELRTENRMARQLA